MILNQDLEYEIMVLLIKEIIKTEDYDENGTVYMKDFTFFNYTNNHILNTYHYNMERFVNVMYRVDRLSVSFFDYVEWYHSKYHRPDLSNNPCNITRYYCSKYTGPAWGICRSGASRTIGYKDGRQIGPSYCQVEKVSNNLLKYTEVHNNELVPLNNGAECLYWQFLYEPFIEEEF